MKLIVILSTIAFSYGETLDTTYLSPNAQASGSSSEIFQAPVSRPIVVLESESFQRQIEETVERNEEIRGPILNSVVEFQRPIIENVVTNNAASQRPINFAIGTKNDAVQDVVRIGNLGKGFVQKQNPVEYKEARYPAPRFQVVEQRTERTQTTHEKHARVLRQEYKNEGDGYVYLYETDNGIWAEQNGVATNGVNAQGAYSYIGDDGVQYSMRYTADENGFQPQGDHIPTPHPIPEEILRSLEQNARDEAAGIFDDGSYDARKYGGEDEINNQKIVSVVTSRPGIIQRYSTVPTIITNRPNVPTIIQNYPTPGYRYPTDLVNQNNNVSPVVNALIQEVSTPSTANQVYLTPVKRKVASETRPSNLKRKKIVYRNRKPEYKKNGDSDKP